MRLSFSEWRRQEMLQSAIDKGAAMLGAAAVLAGVASFALLILVVVSVVADAAGKNGAVVMASIVLVVGVAAGWLAKSVVVSVDCDSAAKIIFNADTGRPVITAADFRRIDLTPWLGGGVRRENLVRDRPYLKVIGIDRRLALVGLRLEVEDALRELARRSNVADQERMLLSDVALQLKVKKVITAEQAKALSQLFRLLNSAVHTKGVVIEAGVERWLINESPALVSTLMDLGS
jgi:hypothetical protein